MILFTGFSNCHRRCIEFNRYFHFRNILSQHPKHYFLLSLSIKSILYLICNRIRRQMLRITIFIHNKKKNNKCNSSSFLFTINKGYIPSGVVYWSISHNIEWNAFPPLILNTSHMIEIYMYDVYLLWFYLHSRISSVRIHSVIQL